MDKVRIFSKIRNKVTVRVPDLRFNRSWPAAGSSVLVDREMLDELMYDTGFRNMIEMGILYIEDMEVKKELGLEPEDATAPVNIIVLSDKDKAQYWSQGLSVVGFKDKIKKLSRPQLEELADYAISHKIMDFDKCEALKERCGKDVIRAIQLEAQDKEA